MPKRKSRKITKRRPRHLKWKNSYLLFLFLFIGIALLLLLNKNCPYNIINNLKLNLSTKNVEIGRKYSFSNIYFDPQTSEIKRQSYYILNRIYRILKNNYRLKVEIRGHTDAPNQALSEIRARKVLNYLANKGIERYRMTAIGMSNSDPFTTDINQLSKNRRVEFIFHY